jgi:hypothetical protein
MLLLTKLVSFQRAKREQRDLASDVMFPEVVMKVATDIIVSIAYSPIG